MSLKYCEKCENILNSNDVVYACSYNCMFCDECTVEMRQICPNCEGQLVIRPKRHDVYELE